MQIKLNDKDLEQYARELFKTAVASYADNEDSVVDAFVKKVVQKHAAPLSIIGHSISNGGFPVKTPLGAFGAKQPSQQPQQPQQLTLFDNMESLLQQEAAVAEQRI